VYAGADKCRGEALATETILEKERLTGSEGDTLRGLRRGGAQCKSDRTNERMHGHA
jgi:hypothetical protein